MMKKVIILAFVSLFILSSAGAYADQATSQPTAQPMEKTKDRLSRAMNNMFCGPTEIAENLDQTNTKGTKLTRCSEKTRSGVERGIARLFAGVWQVATFWYSDPGYSDSGAKSAAANEPSVK